MAIYNLSASVGTRAKGQSAAAKHDYITREGEYAEDEAEVERVTDGNMPPWAQDNPRDYWQAADEGERANGSLFREVQFALPQELSRSERLELAESFARELASGAERLPYTLTVHRGDDVNPHAHLLISERVNDGQARTAKTWFRRFNRQHPERGGARKSRAMQPPKGPERRDWLQSTRAAWELQANEALRRSGSRERIDRRSWSIRRESAMKSGDLEEAARCSRIPNVHRGPRRRQRAGLEQKDRRIRAENERRNGEVARLDKRITAVKKKMERLARARASVILRAVKLSPIEQDMVDVVVNMVVAAEKRKMDGAQRGPASKPEYAKADRELFNALVKEKMERQIRTPAAVMARVADLSPEERYLLEAVVNMVVAAEKRKIDAAQPGTPSRPEKEAVAPASSSEKPKAERQPQPTRWERFQQRRERRRSDASRKQFSERAAGRVIQQLEKGAAPWQQGWRSPQDAQKPPYNPTTGARYQGLNDIVLRSEARERGYDDPRWLTYKQAKKIGAQVRKGEQGTRIEYLQFRPREESDSKAAPAEAGQEKSEAVHRTYTVFNARQINNMPSRGREWVRDWQVCERAQRLLDASGAAIEHHRGNGAKYQPQEDKIVLPGPERFRTTEDYYAAVMHQMVRRTGHKKRLDRETLRRGVEEGAGPDARAKEELRAAMTSMTVNGVMRLPHEPQRHASQVESWIKMLKNDPEELRRAVRDAGAAAEHLLQYDREPPPREPEPRSFATDHSLARERPHELSQELKQGSDRSDDLMSR